VEKRREINGRHDELWTKALSSSRPTTHATVLERELFQSPPKVFDRLEAFRSLAVNRSKACECRRRF
jgi:hypothetical protein